ncbi:MAG: hypothetical protein LBG27_12325 [Spirochaetaceae bacterium]|jgi:hypothetical protein|nr:hypothetical protein [Spirochaetaceae bacterium]
MITTTRLRTQEKPTKEQLKRIERSAKLPVVPDEDCPVYTAEQLACLYAKTRGMWPASNHKEPVTQM